MKAKQTAVASAAISPIKFIVSDLLCNLDEKAFLHLHGR